MHSNALLKLLTESPEGNLIGIPLHRGQLTDNGATPWYAMLSLGTPLAGEPPQTVRMMMDTGTTHTWVTAQACNTVACNAHRKWTPSASSTFEQSGDPSNPVSINFGPWGSLLAVLGQDIMRTAYKDIGYMRFFLATHYSGDQFRNLVCDGGISIPSVIPPETTSPDIRLSRTEFAESSQILDEVKHLGVKPMVTFAFGAEADGLCVLGDFDIDREANVLPVISSGPYYMLWTVKLNLLRCGSQEVLSNINFILDTGSSRFKGDPVYIGALVNAATRNGRLPSVLTSAERLVEYAPITIVLNTESYTLMPEQYFSKIEDDTGKTEWHLAFHAMKDMDNYLLVGSTFLDTVISRFDCDAQTVTLYKGDAIQ